VVQPSRLVSNPYALAAVAVTASLQIMAAEFQPLASVLKTERPGREDWLIVVGLSLVPAFLGQTIKLMTGARRTFVSAGQP
jgi:hypothetical protein